MRVVDYRITRVFFSSVGPGIFHDNAKIHQAQIVKEGFTTENLWVVLEQLYDSAIITTGKSVQNSMKMNC